MFANVWEGLFCIGRETTNFELAICVVERVFMDLEFGFFWWIKGYVRFSGFVLKVLGKQLCWERRITFLFLPGGRPVNIRDKYIVGRHRCSVFLSAVMYQWGGSCEFFSFPCFAWALPRKIGLWTQYSMCRFALMPFKSESIQFRDKSVQSCGFSVLKLLLRKSFQVKLLATFCPLILWILSVMEEGL